MIQPKLMAGNQWLTLSDLKAGKVADNITEHERNAIQFCQRWLNGEQEFEFKTSGSTGTPKQISFKRDELESSARLTERALHLQSGYNALICLDTRFIAGAMMMVRSLVTEMNMILRSPSANPLNDLGEQIDFAAFVPYQVITMLEQTPAQFDKLKTIIIGGAPLKNEVLDQLHGSSTSFYATYGMTETIGHIALQKLNGHDHQDYFEFLPGITGSMDDRGCLILNVPHLHQPTVITNDLVNLFDKNKFRWVGRYDRVINSGGIKVQAEKVEGEVEKLFQELEIQKRFFIIGMPDQKLGERVALVLEGLEMNPNQEDAFKVQLAQRLNAYEIPKLLLYIPRFIETATQKIDRAGTMKTQIESR